MLAWFDGGEETLVAFFRAILSHHGKPLADMPVDASLWKPQEHRDPISAVHHLTTLTKRWFPLAWQSDGETLSERPELQHAFTGLLMLSDWIGSNAKFFPFVSQWPKEDYDELASRQAESVISAMGLDVTKARRGLVLAGDIYDALFSFEPRGAQRACLRLSPEPGPSITVLDLKQASLRLF